MQIDGSLSALNFYGGDAASYSHSRSQDVARLVARCAAVLLGPGEKAPAEDSELLAELARRRSLIARAVETVKQREGVDATAAYRWLALRSGQLGLPLAQVIAQVLAQQSPVVTLEESS